MIWINGYRWNVRMVSSMSSNLIDRTGNLRLATTDPNTMTVYLADTLKGDMLRRVLAHEIGHCVMFSFDLFSELHRMVKPEYWIEAEEWVCNFVADYGMTILNAVQVAIGNKKNICMPYMVESMAA